MTNHLTSKLFAILTGAMVSALPMSAMTTTASAQDAMASTSSSPTSSTATYGDWLLRCSQQTGSVSEPKKVCEVVHVIRVSTKAADGTVSAPQVLAQIAFGSPPDTDDFKIVYQIPSNTWLREPIKLKLAETKEELKDASGDNDQEAAYFNCQGSACLADANPTFTQIEAMTKAKAAQITYIDSARRTINVPVSLKGFADAYAALSESQ